LRSVGENVSRRLAISLYLKRNFVSVFLPVGSISSLAAFSQDVENEGITKLKMSAASAIYLVAGIVTLWIVAIPILVFTAQSQHIDGVAYISLLVLTLLLIGVFFLVVNLKNKGKSHELLTKYAPNIASQINQLLATPMNTKAIIMVNVASLGLEIGGILSLFASIYAIGLNIYWLIPCLAYTISTLILYVAPVARGVGAVELSLIYVLTHNGIDDNSALTVTLLYRFFGFWWPLVLGGLSFIPISKRL
jgi:phosphatidylglycerol lysyltransferase